MGLFDFLKSKRFEDMLDAELESVLAEPESKDEIYCEIAENYINKYPVEHLFETPHLHALNEKLMEKGQKIIR